MSPDASEPKQSIGNRIRKAVARGLLKASEEIAASPILVQYDVWYNYTGFLVGTMPGLLDVAKLLVESRLCRAAVHTSGLAIWSAETETRIELIDARHSEFAAQTHVKYPKELRGFELECVHNAIMAQSNEHAIFSGLTQSVTEHVRAYMDPCVFTFDQEEYYVYPVLKVYSNGIYTLAFRRVIRHGRVAVKEFIDEELNLFRRASNQVLVPPVLLNLTAREALLRPEEPVLNLGDERFVALKNTNPLHRQHTLDMLKRAEETVRESTKTYASGDFEYTLAPANPELLAPSGIFLETLRSYVDDALCSLLNPPREGADFLLRGPAKPTLTASPYWSGRPNVVVLKTAPEVPTAPDLVERYRADWGRIILRSIEAPDEQARAALPASKRIFDDHSVHVASNMILFVWGANAVARNVSRDDGNLSHTVYGGQVKAELIDFLYAWWRSLEQRSTSPAKRIEDVLATRREVLMLEEVIARSSNYGEVIDLVQDALATLNVARLRETVDRGTELQLASLKESRDATFSRYGVALAIMFGLVGTTGLSDAVTKPVLVHYYAQPGQTDFSAIGIVAFLLSAGALLFATLIVWMSVRARRRDAR